MEKSEVRGRGGERDLRGELPRVLLLLIGSSVVWSEQYVRKRLGVVVPRRRVRVHQIGGTRAACWCWDLGGSTTTPLDCLTKNFGCVRWRSTETRGEAVVGSGGGSGGGGEVRLWLCSLFGEDTRRHPEQLVVVVVSLMLVIIKRRTAPFAYWPLRTSEAGRRCCALSEGKGTRLISRRDWGVCAK